MEESKQTSIKYAEILPFEEEDRRIHLKLIGDDNSAPKSTLSISQKQFRDRGLAPLAGQKIIIHVPSDNKALLVAAQTAPNQPIRVTGRLYNKFGRTAFQPNNKGIKEDFMILSMPIKRIEHGDHCVAEIPDNFDPNDPQVMLSENQAEDFATGEDIITALVKKHGFKPEHDKKTLKYASKITTHNIDFSGRADIRHENLIAIDPPGARDRDDAIMVEKTDYGWRSIVAIADVAAVVHYNTILDRAAYERGTTTYPPNADPYHMLPRHIVDQCSLNEGMERPVIYLEKTYDHEGNSLTRKFNLGVAQVKMAMTYDDYYKKAFANDPSVTDLHNFFKLQKHRKTYNMDIAQEFEGIAHFSGVSTSPVEWLMIDANQEAADFTSKHGIESIYRNNGPVVDGEAYKKLRKKLKKINITLPQNPRNCGFKTLQNAITEAANRGLEIRANNLVQRYVLLRLAKRPHGGADRLGDLAFAARADDGRGDLRPAQRPRHGKLRDGVSAWLGDGPELIHQLQERLKLGRTEQGGHRVVLLLVAAPVGLR